MKLLSLLVLASVTLQSRLVRRVIESETTTAKSWMVYLKHKDGQFCGGTLYTRSLVITTAHSNILLTKDWKAYPNLLDVNDVGTAQHPGQKVIKRINHPGNSNAREDYDIAVWWIKGNSKTRTSVILTDKREFDDISNFVYFLGWGTTNVITRKEGRKKTFETVLNDKLQKAGVPLVSDDTCARRYPDEFVRDIMFCMGEMVCGPSTGLGDSGGPVYRERNNQIILMGVISFSKGCGYKDYKDVVTKISAPEIKNFIDHHINHFDPTHLDSKDKPTRSIPVFPFTPRTSSVTPQVTSPRKGTKRPHNQV